MKLTRNGLAFLFLILAPDLHAAQGLGFGLSQKYCLGTICLGDIDAEHPELNIKSVFYDIKKIKIPICYSSTFPVPPYRFPDGFQGEFTIQNDPGRSNASIDEYFRIQSIRIRFDPALSPETARNLEQKIVSRYGMKKSTYRTFYVLDGTRKITFTNNGAANFNLDVTGIDGAEYLAQPGCTRKVPDL